MNSFNAKGFTASNKGIRTNGTESLFNNMAFVGRAEYNPLPYLTVAGSIFLGNTGQDARVDDPESQFDGQKIKGFFQMYEGDIQVQYAGFEGRALAVFTRLDDAALLDALNGFVRMIPSGTSSGRLCQADATSRSLATSRVSIFSIWPRLSVGCIRYPGTHFGLRA
jgi:hypothetical protein